jgi:putative ABC transport system substrate-binding protein
MRENDEQAAGLHPRVEADSALRTTRRALVLALGASVIVPACAFAQGTKRRPVVGVIRINPRGVNEVFLEPFRRDMTALGWKERENVDFLFTWADGRNDRLPALAAEMVARGVDVIVTFGAPGVRAAQAASSIIPIVGMADDMVGAGLVRSMARPGGNITGVSILATELDAKRLEILHEAAPAARRIGVLHDPSITRSIAAIKDAGRSFGVELVFAPAQTDAEIDVAIKSLIKSRVTAVNVLASPVLNASRARQISVFRQARIPSIYEWPETAEEGGLVGYGPRYTVVCRQVAELIDKLLRGAKPANLPVEQPTKFELVINMKTAKTLGIKMPNSILVRADKVIE